MKKITYGNDNVLGATSTKALKALMVENAKAGKFEVPDDKATGIVKITINAPDLEEFFVVKSKKSFAY